jgi:hypothetical protein
MEAWMSVRNFPLIDGSSPAKTLLLPIVINRHNTNNAEVALILKFTFMVFSFLIFDFEQAMEYPIAKKQGGYSLISIHLLLGSS